MKIALIGDTHYGYTYNTPEILEEKLEELSKEDFDLVIHTGDWISHMQDQLDPMLELFRKHIPSKPILGVMGNHDYWNKHSPKSVLSMTKVHKKLFKKYNIHYLESEPFIFEGISIWGFNGWYCVSNPPTNDIYYMSKLEKGQHVHDYLSNIAHKGLEKILSDSRNCTGTKICVTHFPPYTFNQLYKTMCANELYLDMICENFNYFFVGHSHQNEGWQRKDCFVVNPGGDYNKPNYKIIVV